MSAITSVTLLPMAAAGLDTSAALLPPIRILVAYGVFFTFGWLLYRRRDLLETFGARWKGRCWPASPAPSRTSRSSSASRSAIRG